MGFEEGEFEGEFQTSFFLLILCLIFRQKGVGRQLLRPRGVLSRIPYLLIAC